jgi:DNA-binding MarR family transcriptional regulator
MNDYDNFDKRTVRIQDKEPSTVAIDLCPVADMRGEIMQSVAPTDITAESCARDVMETIPLVMRFLRAEIRSRRAPSLSVPQFRVLAFLRREPGASLSHVAEHLGVARSTASAVVDRLVRRNLVRRAEHPQERRSVVLSLTTTGARQFAQARNAACATVAEVLAHLSAADLRSITAGLHILGSAFQDVVPGRSSSE